MNRIVNFFHYAACYFSYLYKIFWEDLDVSIKSALIAAIVSLFIVYLQKSQQRDKDRDQLAESEQNKLRYLYFLMQDTYKMADRFHLATKELNASFVNNPFILPNFIYYPPQSLEDITNKINQEDYYLASVHQLKKDDIAEIFLLYNAMYTAESKAREHYFAEFPKMIKSKEEAYTALRDLTRSINAYLVDTNTGKITETERIAYSQLNNFMVGLDNFLPRTLSYEDKLLQSEMKYLIPVIDILSAHRDVIVIRKLLQQANEVFSDHRNSKTHLQNVIKNTEQNDLEINSLVTRLKAISQPLDLYIKTLPAR